MKIAFIAALEMGHEVVKRLAAAGGKHKIMVFTISDLYKDRSGYKSFSDLRGKVDLVEIDPANDGALTEGELSTFSPDVIFVIGWSFMIPEAVLGKAKYVIGHHPTLLPRHRGNAPIPWALINGLTKTGVTFFILRGTPDSGPIVAQKEIGIEFGDDAASLYRKITDASASMVPEIVSRIGKDKLELIEQDEKKASKWPKRKPEDGIMDWNVMSIPLYNWVRGLTHPYPGAFTFIRKKKLYVWKAHISEAKADAARPGEIVNVSGGLLVKTGDGALLLERVQLDGEEEMSAAEFAKRHKLRPGFIFG